MCACNGCRPVYLEPNMVIAGDLRRWKSLIFAIDFVLGLCTPYE